MHRLQLCAVCTPLARRAVGAHDVRKACFEPRTAHTASAGSRGAQRRIRFARKSRSEFKPFSKWSTRRTQKSPALKFDAGPQTTQALAATVGDLLESGAFDSLDSGDTAFHAISMSRMGYYGDEELADKLFEALRTRGLARRSEDGVSIPLHPLVRYLILTLLAQLLRTKGSHAGLELSPATDRTEVVRALAEFLNIPRLPSAGHVVAFDLETVTVDLSSVPLDEVLAFRDEHRTDYRKYARSIRMFARQLSLLSPEDRTAAFRDRQDELDDLASDLRRKARSAWRRPASFSLGLAGASWSLLSNPVGGLLALGGLFARGLDKSSNEAGAFSYLFAANKRFA